MPNELNDRPEQPRQPRNLQVNETILIFILQTEFIEWILFDLGTVTICHGSYTCRRRTKSIQFPTT